MNADPERPGVLAWVSPDRTDVVLIDGRPVAVDVYPVGVLAAYRNWRAGMGWRGPWRRPWRRECGYLGRRIRERDWRAVRNSFNGYLAEPRNWPPGLRRCGSGWTRRRALRDLRRRIAAAGRG